jgi:hypothetical protein
MRNRIRLCWLLLALLPVAGCQVKVDKSEDGKDVKIATPFGSIAVNKNQGSAADVGLPAYPGATLAADHDGDQSARVDMGFGDWKLKVRTAHYVSSDDREKVVAFYRKALSQYGGVIECSGKRPVGSPVRTEEGLTCDDSDKHKGSFRTSTDGDVQLKAGSPRHQHLVAFRNDSGSTDFNLIALDLPHGLDEQHGTN